MKLFGFLLLVGVVLTYWQYFAAALLLVWLWKMAPRWWSAYQVAKATRAQVAQGLRERADQSLGELIYYGYSGHTAWAFSTPEQLGEWAAQHPEGTFDVAVRGSGQ